MPRALMCPNNMAALLDQAVVSAKISTESRSLRGRPNPTADPLVRRTIGGATEKGRLEFPVPVREG